MKILKRNQLIILVISLMLVTAGYLNFTSDNYNKEISSEVLADLGDATLVNSNEIENKDDKTNNVEEDLVENNETDIKIQEEEKNEDIIETVQEDTYFTSSRLERENMYSQMLETYQEIYNNTNSTAEQKNIAIEEIAKINKMRNSIMIAENLVIAKGFKNIVIFANDSSVSVIVKAENLEQEQIAQIQNIVSRELEVGAENINISTKWKKIKICKIMKEKNKKRRII